MFYIEDIVKNPDGIVYGIRDTYDRVKEYYNLEQLNQIVNSGIQLYGLSLTKRGRVEIKESFILYESYFIGNIRHILEQLDDCINAYIYKISNDSVSIKIIGKYRDYKCTYTKALVEILSVFTDSIKGIVRDNGVVSFYNYYESDILNNLDRYFLRKEYLNLDYDLFVSNLKYVIANLKTEFHRSYYLDANSDDLRRCNWSTLFELVSLRKPFVFVIEANYLIKEIHILGMDKIGYYIAHFDMETYISFLGQDFESDDYSVACAGNHFREGRHECPILMKVIKKSKK